MNRTIITASLFLLSACGISQIRREEIIVGKVKDRAAYDFDCDKNNLRITKIDNGTYGAKGCEKKGTYVISGAPACNLDSGQSENFLTQICSPVLNTPSKGTDSK